MPPPALLFSQNRPIKTERKPFSQKKKLIWKFCFNYSFCAQPKPENVLIRKRSETKWKKKVF